MKQRGYTYVGVLIAISISVVFSIAILGETQADSRIELLKRSSLSVERLHTAVQSYYDARCQLGTVPNPTLDSLLNEGYLDSKAHVALHFSAKFSDIVIAKRSGGTSFKYTVSFATNSDAEIAGSNNFNAFVSNNLVTWNITNGSDSSSSLAEGYEYLRAFGANFC